MNRRQQYDFDEEINELGYQLKYRHHNDPNRYRFAEDMLPRKANPNRQKRNSRKSEDF